MYTVWLYGWNNWRSNYLVILPPNRKDMCYYDVIMIINTIFVFGGKGFAPFLAAENTLIV